MVRRWSREYSSAGLGSFADDGKHVIIADQREIAQLKKALKEAEIEREF